MKRLIVTGLLLMAMIRGVRGEEGRFTSVVTSEDLAAAGLAGLTPAQLARLDALVEDYKRGLLPKSRPPVGDTTMAPRPVITPSAGPKTTARIAPAEAPKVEAGKSEHTPSLLAKAKAVFGPSKRAETEIVESTIPGKFRGWEPHQIFVLANGQRWQVATGDSYYTPAVENPKVQILPASMAGYWLRFPTLDTQVRVNFVGEN